MPPPSPDDDARPASAPEGSGGDRGPRRTSRSQLRAFAAQLMPEGSRGRDLVRFARLSQRDAGRFADLVRKHWAAWGVSGPARSYQWWLYTHRRTRRDLDVERRRARRWPNPVTVGIVLVGAGDHQGAAATLRSLRDQTWRHWRAAVPTGLTADLESDERIVEVDDVGPDAAMAAVAALRLAPRDLVLFVEPGDRFVAWALFHIAEPPWRNPNVDLVYWDDDMLDSFGRVRDPRFRPAWSPETLLGANYLGRSFAIRARALSRGGGLRAELGDAMWWDLLLGSGFRQEQTERVPVVLSHLVRRPAPSSASSVRTVHEHLDRRQERAEVTMPADTVRVSWEVDRWPAVTVIIPTRHNRPLVQRCLRSLTRTDYDPFNVVVVDNGDHTPENEAWYQREFPDLDLAVEWWDRPFNYSAVNNSAASTARGELLVFLNDDTEAIDPGWLRELASWARRPELGLVGLQLLGGDARIQHGGVVLGLNGFAGHLFAGMQPGVDTIFGSTNWYRNVLAVTGACLAVRRELFDQVGGFDERFVLCGSDVVLGLDTTMAGKRNVCLPSHGVRHLEAATRGTSIPGTDFFASYWRYQRWLFGGDPYFSPNLSLLSGEPELRAQHEARPHALVSGPLGRPIRVFRQGNDAAEGVALADMFRATDADVDRVRAIHAASPGPHPPRSVTWFLPDVDSPFYGGVNTALRIADNLARTHGVENRFAIWADENDGFFRSALGAAFPSLGDSQLSFYQSPGPEELATLPESDLAIATLWATAYSVAKLPWAGRRFYLIQDFEPAFYPAGTLYALAEETYRLGLYGLCNTEHMLELYRTRYGGAGGAFMPAVDTNVFHAEGRREPLGDEPATVFVYARPGHFRNCWEMASIALVELKERLGDRVRIVTAGSWAYGEDDQLGIEHLGMLDYRETGALYRHCDVGVALTVSQHPSYLPLELMACGVPVVAYDNPAGYWLLEHEQNSLLVRRTVDGLRDGIERLVLDTDLRARLRRGAVRTIAERYASWDKAVSGIYALLTDPNDSAPLRP